MRDWRMTEVCVRQCAVRKMPDMGDAIGVGAGRTRTKWVIVLGAGGVGRAFVRALRSARADHAQRLGLHLQIVTLADSTAYLANPSRPLTDAELDAALSAKDSRKSLSTVSGSKTYNSPLALMQRLAQGLDAPAIVLDTTATDATTPALLAALEMGHSIVLANKKPLTTDQEVYDRLTRADVTEDGAVTSRARWGTTCGAALPVIATQQRLLAGGDSIERIAGTLSGTLGYVMAGLQQGQLFSDVVRDAHQLGYTEPDPRDDLGGIDVARKALILARGMGWRLELADVQVESLFPLHMGSLSVAEFLTALPQLDAHFAQLAKGAAAQGGVLRFAATIAEGKCKVGPTVVPAASPLGRLEGSDNLVEFYTRWYSPTPLVIQGKGAGVEVTASGVLADVVDLATA